MPHRLITFQEDKSDRLSFSLVLNCLKATEAKTFLEKSVILDYAYRKIVIQVTFFLGCLFAFHKIE